MKRTGLFLNILSLLLLLSVATPARPMLAGDGDEIIQGSTLSAGNSIYRVHVQEIPGANTGLYTATTGPGHPAGPGLNILFGDGLPGTTFNTIRSYTSGTDYVQSPAKDSVNEDVYLAPYGTLTPIGSTGFRTTYDLPGPPNTPDALTIISDVNVNGTAFEDSSIEVTTTIVNNGDAPVDIGVRYHWDFQIGLDDGPSLQEINPTGLVRVHEMESLGPSFEYYQIEDNDLNLDPPTFHIFGTVTGPSTITPTPTPPDLLQYVCWWDAFNTAFEYPVDPSRDIASLTSDCGPPGGDSAVHYFFGHDQDNAISIPPGQSHTVSASLFLTPPPEIGIELTPEQATNDVGTPHTVTAIVRDEQDRLLSDQEVRFVVNGANSAEGSDITDANGQATFTYTGVNDGQDTITAWVDQDGDAAQDPGEPFAVATKTWNPVADFLTISLTPETAVNPIGTQHTVTALVLDSVSNPVPDQLVKIQVSGAHTVSGSSPTDETGQISLSYVGLNTGQDTITGWVDLDGDGSQGSDEPFDTATKTWERSTAVTLTSFTAANLGDLVRVEWETASEIDNEGFNLWRSRTQDGPYTQLNPGLIPAQGNPDTGSSYQYVDSDVVKGQDYYYKLEDVDIHGFSTFHGPVSAMASPIRWIYLPLIFK